MYKDVWKRFGTKILIVFCSVLLLGGVAIAAPRLRAAGDLNIDLGTIGTANPVSGAAITVTNKNLLLYDKGDPVYPVLQLEYNDENGTKKTQSLVQGTDYELSVTSGNWTQANTVQVTMTAKSKGSNQYLLPGSSYSFGYTILPIELPGSLKYETINPKPTEYDGISDKDLVVENVSSPLESSQLKVWLEISGQSEPTIINSTEYSICADSTNGNQAIPGSLRGYNGYLKLNNYKNSSGSQYFAMSVNVVKHVKQLTAYMGTGNTLFQNYPSGEVAERNPAVRVVDPDNSSTDLTEGTHYSVENIETTDGRKVTITGMGNYKGTRVREYSLNKPTVSFDFTDNSYKSVREYDEVNNTYRFDPETIAMTVTTVDGGNTSTDTTTLNSGQFKITECVIVKDNGDIIEGATAGLVRMTVEATVSGYGTHTGTLFYRVRRNLANMRIEGAANQKLQWNDPIPTDAADPGPYTYNGDQHMMLPSMYFSLSREDAGLNKNTYELLKDTDYSVEYEVLREGGTVNGLIAGIDAGTVVMVIKGAASDSPTNAGYYGTIRGSDEIPKATYEIKPQGVENYILHLKKTSYPLRTTADTVIKDASLRAQSGSGTIWNIDPGKKGAEYKVTFYYINPDTNQRETVRNLENGAPGKYIVAFEFTGNFTGELEAEFEISAHNEGNIDVRVGSCEQDGPDGHIYNGSEHEPEVKVWSNILNEELILGDSAGFTVRYEDNVNVGYAKVYVKLAGNSEEIPTPWEFQIVPCRLVQDANHYFNFLDEDGFVTTGTGKTDATHEYCGRGNAPQLSGLNYTFSYEKDGQTITQEVALENGKDFTVEPNKLYTAAGVAVNMSNIDTNTEYYYRIDIVQNGNFSADKNNRVLVGPFKFTAKDINSDDVKWNEEISMPDWDFAGKNLENEVKKWLVTNKNLIVTDYGFTPSQTLIAGTDYQVIFDAGDGSNIDKDGTIKFTIEGQGCYTGKKQHLVLKTGQDIADGQVRERGYNDYLNFVDRTLRLADRYGATEDSDDPYGLKLNKTTTHDRKGVSVYHTVNGSRQIIALDSKYTVVEYTDPDYSQEGSQKEIYASVTIQGINGYHGTAVIEFPVQRINMEDNDVKKDFEIIIVEQIYTGKPIQPLDSEITVKYKGEVLDPKYYTIGDADRNLDNTEAYTEANKERYWARVPIYGRNGYTGMIYGYFKILKRDISMENPDDPSGDKIMSSLFRFQDDYESTIDYRPYTISEVMGRKDGAWQDVTLWFNPEKTSSTSQYTKLKGGIDYEYNCSKSKTEQLIPTRGEAFITVTGKGNFKGTFIEKYTVSPTSLKDDCTLAIKDNVRWFLFDGSEIQPTVVVRQKANAGEAGEEDGYTLTKDVDFKVEYINSMFVSKSSDLTNKNATYLRIKGMGGDDANYIDEQEITYVIYDLLDPSEALGAAKNSKLEYTDPIVVDYADPMAYDSLKLTLLQREENYEYHTKDHSDQYSMIWKNDYTVNCSDETAGKRTALIVGTGNGVDRGVIVGQKRIPITIQANLRDTDKEVLWKNNNNTNNVSFVTGTSITYEDLASLLTIRCGGRNMEYLKDYVFDGKLATELGGPYSIAIKPTDEAYEGGNGYLVGSFNIDYNITSNIESSQTGIQDVYRYKHGIAVFDPMNDDFNVVINGQKLNNRTDYTVSVYQGDEEVREPINCGSYRYTITGMGSYSGVIRGTFEIVPYDFSADYAKDRVVVSLTSDKVTYSGSAGSLPEISSVIVLEGTHNTKFELKQMDADGNGDFGVRAGGGDNVNWTDVESGKEPPKVAVYGNANYTGEVLVPYYIVQKDISDSDIEINRDSLNGFEYQNGAPVKPYPEITYTDGTEEKNVIMKLNGIEYMDANAGMYDKWTDLSTHFTYRYQNDVTTTGEKEILIRGIGNFTGSRSVTYTVRPLNLKNTKLTFVSEESPVYDGEEQKPSFRLMYNELEILACMNGTVTSTYIDSANVRCTFENNINASTDESKAKVTVEVINADNYEGKIEAYFTILPAPLDNHTRFMYRPIGSNADVDLSGYRMNLDFKGVGTTVRPGYAADGNELQEGQVGIYYNFADKANHGAFLIPGGDYYNDPNGDEGFRIEYRYVEPDTENEDAREEYQDPDTSYAGKVRVTITGKGNYTGSASFWYFIGKDISADAKISISPTTAVYNSQSQAPTVKITGVDKETCTIAEYRNEVKVENLIRDRNRDFINAGTYYIRVEGDPKKGTYATKPETLTFTITPRAFSNNLIIDGFKREYSYTGYDICPVGISVTDYIDNTKYRLTEDVDYTLTYTNNLNAGTAYINVEGKNNFSGKATANFMITSSTISSGGSWGSNSFLDQGTGEISGSTAVAPSDVSLSMDTVDAMYYTGKAVYPKVSVPGMTENVDYTVTFSNNVEVGTAVATITGMGNNNGTITKNFRIIAQLSKCTISPIPAQQYTGSEVKPALTVRCGNNILMEGTDYTATYSNNVNIGTATVTLRALNNANYTGSTTVKFSIGNDVGGFIISGYAPSYAYTGNAITPGVVVETGSRTLVLGTEYTVSYSNNVNAGVATITVTGIGRYSGTQTATFVIEPKSMQSLDTSDVSDRTYTGDAYTPDITVSDGGKVLTKGVDYTVTYKNNTDPGTASIVIQGTNSNYAGTKVVSFKISAVAVKGLKASSVKYNSLKLKWTKQGYADGYQICNSNSKVIKTVKTNSATITGLSAGKTYKYKVRSYVKNTDGTKSYGAFSSVLSTTTKLKTPTVKVVSNAKGQARISWSKVTGASGYEIYYKKSAKATYKKLKTVNNPNVRVCTVRGMKSGDRAYFRIRAFRKNGSKKVYSALNPLKVITVK